MRHANFGAVFPAVSHCVHSCLHLSLHILELSAVSPPLSIASLQSLGCALMLSARPFFRVTIFF